jgi:8-oxo-dGTP pyrophosphatase MutT (NUDIX family)
LSAIGIEHVDALDCRVEYFDWPFARDAAARIDAHWDKLRAAQPRLWNGRVLMCRAAAIEIRDGRRVLASTHFETDFKAFLAWRDFGFPDPHIHNCFAMAALRASDGAFLLGRMGSHTANPGRIYFAAGTPDPDDIRGDRLDLAGSVLRELEEETGFSAADVEETPGYAIVFAGPRIACMKSLRLRVTASAAIARVSAFLAAEHDPELDGLVAVPDEAAVDPAVMPDFVVAYLRRALAAQAPPG